MKSLILGSLCGAAVAVTILLAAGRPAARGNSVDERSVDGMTHADLILLVDGLEKELSQIDGTLTKEAIVERVRGMQRRIVISKLPVD